MCDTMVCLPSVTKNGKMIFAKNSDRSPNEPHIVKRIPAIQHDIINNPKVKTTYINVDQVPYTYAVTLFKPSWIWGAEMGFNEYGVNIGNEAVFTKSKRGKEALIGMDMLRLALERSQTAYDAMLCITRLLEEYGQGGNCGYDKKFFYDNSFLIADGKEAYVLETSGQYWVAKKVKDFYAISNGLTIEDDFDFAHPVIVSQRESTPDFSFVKYYKEPIFTHFSQSKVRRETAQKMLIAEKGNITVETLMNILRSHNTLKEDSASVGSICMHAGASIGDHTTGSYIVEYGDKYDMYYATAASTPCISLFKPLLSEYSQGDCSGTGLDYWYNRELLTRYFISGQAEKSSFLAQRDKIEQDMLDRIKEANNKEDIKKIIVDINSREQMLINDYLGPLQGVMFRFNKGNIKYKKYWAKKTKVLLRNRKKT